MIQSYSTLVQGLLVQSNIRSHAQGFFLANISTALFISTAKCVNVHQGQSNQSVGALYSCSWHWMIVQLWLIKLPDPCIYLDAGFLLYCQECQRYLWGTRVLADSTTPPHNSSIQFHLQRSLWLCGKIKILKQHGRHICKHSLQFGWHKKLCRVPMCTLVVYLWVRHFLMRRAVHAELSPCDCPPNIRCFVYGSILWSAIRRNH